MYMSDEIEYLTQTKYDEFKAELEYLKHDKRKEVAQNLEYAKALGDLSENAEYHAAREDQAELEDRIKKLETLLKRAQIISEKHATDKVTAGSVVTVKKEGSSETNTYTIVGSEEADMSQGKISNHSPLGHALVGKKTGEEFVFTTPSGAKMKYKVVGIK